MIAKSMNDEENIKEDVCFLNNRPIGNGIDNMASPIRLAQPHWFGSAMKFEALNRLNDHS